MRAARCLKADEAVTKSSISLAHSLVLGVRTVSASGGSERKRITESEQNTFLVDTRNIHAHGRGFLPKLEEGPRRYHSVEIRMDPRIRITLRIIEERSH